MQNWRRRSSTRSIARIGAALSVASEEVGLDVLADALGRPGVQRARRGGNVLDGSRCRARTTRRLLPPWRRRRRRNAPARGRHDLPMARRLRPRSPSRWTKGPAACTSSFDPVQVLVASEDLDAELVPLEDEPLFQARSLDGQRRVAAPSMVEFEGGPWAVRVTAPDDIRLSTGERWLIGVQLALGTVVAMLALGGLLAEHRALHRRATTDGLTDLPNRAEFERRAGELLGRLRRDGRPACLFLIDLDHFKAVNDTVGHDAGDRVLVDVAQRLRQAVRSSDLVGRWGGDEFVVLMPGIGDPRAVPARAATIAERAGRQRPPSAPSRPKRASERHCSPRTDSGSMTSCATPTAPCTRRRCTTRRTPSPVIWADLRHRHSGR